MVAEGEKVVTALFQSGITPIALLAEPKHYDRLEPWIKQTALSPQYMYEASASLLKEVVGYRMHQGVMALALIPQQVSLSMLSFPIVALNGLANGENVGAIIRTAVAFGVKSLLVDSDCASPFLRRSIKVAMGTAFQVDWHQTSDLPQALADLKERGGDVVAIEANPQSQSLRDYTLSEKSVLVFGSEGHGLEEAVSQSCETSLTIPMSQEVDSLNVAAACSILLYHLPHR